VPTAKKKPLWSLLTSEERDQLNRLLRARELRSHHKLEEPDEKERRLGEHRVLVQVLLNYAWRGWCDKEIAALVGTNPRTIGRWLSEAEGAAPIVIPWRTTARHPDRPQSRHEPLPLDDEMMRGLESVAEQMALDLAELVAMFLRRNPQPPMVSDSRHQRDRRARKPRSRRVPK
jgi:hypothetical protein